ncbi:putative cytochrome p450 protein [Phaeoacremonium minimum UCRPA7]|uniref:Putative cytochrome p450 protein n=1 Tax=Phaeoacremonium minimum (strain UCR-PA7) TaxID=1286976 RepID=R8B8K1_PHAM7|nr:putative cytochrome p450 protein [Phaeoacremonium minimum UCRPA7]EON95597.1 putative cytochrome p450 protein [Phaeoacremonium minimum UCRPA7]
MYTNDADAIRQIGARREHFLKPTENYTILEMFGRNVLTSEGTTWRMHRKATAASFNEKNAAYTFAESISQTKGMIEHWLGPNGESSSKTISTIERDTMTLALNIIGYVGFGLKLLWPGQTLPQGISPKLVKYGKSEPPEGYTMSFADSLATVLDKILALLLIPKWLLKILPFRSMRQALEANDNYVKFIEEFLQEKIEEVKNGSQGDGMNIMGQLVRSKYGRTDDKQGERTNQFQLSDSDITGNAFIIIVAGHETTANAMHFTLLELANNPAAQRALQADVDRLFGESEPASWNYEQSINAMMASQLAACMNETLRLMPSVAEIPKKVTPGQDQILTIDGEKHVLPESMAIILNTVAVHRNPRYWPEKPSTVTGQASDLNDFVPKRWFRPSIAKAEKELEVEGADTEDYGGFKGPDTSASLFRPVRGSFIPFSDGARSCLGRRIAQVEMLAALAVVFQKYSIELAVDEWATDKEVAKMSLEERRDLYRKAQDKSRATLRHASSMLTLKLHGGLYVPIRLVRRGEERFIGHVDA